MRLVSDRGNPEVPDFLEYSRLGPWGAGDFRSEDGDQIYLENRTEVNGNHKKVYHLTKARDESAGLHQHPFDKEYSLGSSPHLGTNPGSLLLGSLQRTYKKNTIEYKPVLRSKKNTPRKQATVNMNYSKLDQVLQKYSPKYKLV